MKVILFGQILDAHFFYQIHYHSFSYLKHVSNEDVKNNSKKYLHIIMLCKCHT